MQLVGARAGLDPHLPGNKCAPFCLLDEAASLHSLTPSLSPSLLPPPPARHGEAPTGTGSSSTLALEQICTVPDREGASGLATRGLHVSLPPGQKPRTPDRNRESAYLRAHQHCHHGHPPGTPPLTLSGFARVGGFGRAQRPEGDDDLVDTDPFFRVLLRHVGQELRLTRGEKVTAFTHEDGRVLCKKKECYVIASSQKQ